MAEPRFQRRKEDRPAEITEAAVAVFSEKGYAATRVDDVAKRAGVSKGLLYLYVKTKEELFKAVIRSFIEPRVDALRSGIRETDLSAEEYLRGPFLDFIRQIPQSQARVIVRLMVAEGPRHPDLTAYYWEHVVSVGMDALRQLVRKGIDNGEFRASALQRFPHLIVAPVLFSILYSIVFGQHETLDTDSMLEAHVELIIGGLKSGTPGGEAA